jgi:hypothetical protein
VLLVACLLVAACCFVLYCLLLLVASCCLLLVRGQAAAVVNWSHCAGGEAGQVETGQCAACCFGRLVWRDVTAAVLTEDMAGEGLCFLSLSIRGG